MNLPGTFVHWSIFDVSVANLVLIAVMVAIFGAALLLPFPTGTPCGARHRCRSGRGRPAVRPPVRPPAAER